MAKFSDNFVALTCPNCGGAVKITKEKSKSDFYNVGDVWIFHGSDGKEKIKCENCGTEFERSHQFKQYVEGGSHTVIGNGNVVGSGNVVVGGGRRGGVSIGNIVSDGGEVNISGGGMVVINGKRY